MNEISASQTRPVKIENVLQNNSYDTKNYVQSFRRVIISE